MVTPVRIDPTARDIQIELNDSCNCCCFGWIFNRAPKADTLFYVNSRGEAVKFDFKKVTSEMEALQRAVSNLNRHIDALAEEARLDRAATRRRIEEIAEVSLSEEEPTALTLGMLEKINGAIRSIFE